jgi:hypothetical protein
MNIAGIAARTQLVTLTTGAFRPTRRHRAETAAENQRHNTTAARVSVRLTDHPALKEIGRIHHGAYRVHRSLTLPSLQDGMRLLPIGQQFNHSAQLASYRNQHDLTVPQFLADYPAIRAASPTQLGTLHDPDLWPDDVTTAFVFDVRYLPCPIDGDWATWLEESARAAEDEVRERVTDALQRVVDRCTAEGPLFATVFSDLADLADMLPDLNLTAAPDIAIVGDQARVLAATDVADARDDVQVRADAAREAERLLAMLD